MAKEEEKEAIANPASLGLAAFGLTTVVLSLFNADILPMAGAAVVVPLAMAYGGTGQFLAGMWEFKKGNTLVPQRFHPSVHSGGSMPYLTGR